MVSGRSRAHYLGMESSEHKIAVGKRLRLTIETLELRQIDVARQFGISPSKLGNWLRGVNYPETLALIEFCDTYKLTMDWFLRGPAAGVPGPLADILWRAGEAAKADAPSKAES